MATNMRYLSPRADLSSSLKSQMVHRGSRFQHPRFLPTSGDLRHFGFAWGEGNGPSSVGLWIAQLQLCTTLCWCRCQGGGIMHRCVWASKVFRVSCLDEMYLPSVRPALLRFRKVRRCNLSLTKTMTQFPLRWSGTTKQKSCPLLVFKPDEPLNEPYQLHVQLLYVPHSFRRDQLAKTEWMSWVGCWRVGDGCQYMALLLANAKISNKSPCNRLVIYWRVVWCQSTLLQLHFLFVFASYCGSWCVQDHSVFRSDIPQRI